VDGDDVGQVAGGAREPDVYSTKDTLPNAEPKNGQALLELEGLLGEWNATAPGLCQDRVSEQAVRMGDHLLVRYTHGYARPYRTGTWRPTMVKPSRRRRGVNTGTGPGSRRCRCSIVPPGNPADVEKIRPRPGAGVWCPALRAAPSVRRRAG
jgi:hypothetical protein